MVDSRRTDSRRSGAEIDDLMETVGTHIRSIAEMQRKRSELVATASARDRRITVTCNADGVPIDIDFADDIDDLDYDDIATGVLEAAQAAATEVATLAEDLLAPVRTARSRLPSLSSMVEGMPDLRTDVPELQRASFEPNRFPADDSRPRRRSVIDSE
ncbi:YbaB/EbfC family nucleoid-associated protein [Nocardia sp. NPDC060256]|uniref:YbaB/EbfC family nucleoid-associated protein n=1 Tax=unclassified Nocardia TaxID=2637762 RepID=UPI00364B6D62